MHFWREYGILVLIKPGPAGRNHKEESFLSPEPIWPQLLLQLILILLNAFFAAAELAVLSLNENVVRRQAEDGDKKAALLLRIVQNPTKFLSTIQIGITLAGFLGAAYAADNFASRITSWLVDGLGFTALPEEAVHSVSVILITVALSFLTLIFGELVPKRVALQKADQVARMAGGVIRILSVVMSPFIALLTICTNGVLRLMGVDPNADEDEVSEEGIRMMVDIGEEQGAIERDEKEMIENVFEFNDTVAGDVMVHRTDMVLLWAEDTDEEIVKTALAEPKIVKLAEGKELVKSKVKLLVTMAGCFDNPEHHEYNVVTDIPAARKVFEEWPGTVVTSPFELGMDVLYPASSIENDFGWTPSHPVVEAYKCYLQMPYDRPTWDLTALLYAVEGGDMFSISPAGRISVTDEGATSFTPDPSGNRHYLYTDKVQNEAIEKHFVEMISADPASFAAQK